MTDYEYKVCSFCGEEIMHQAIKCKHCQTMLYQSSVNQQQISNKEEGNPLAIWGFVCALLGLMLIVPFIDIIISLMGTIFSIVAVNKQKLKGLAIAGIILGVLGVIGAITMLITDPGFYSL